MSIDTPATRSATAIFDMEAPFEEVGVDEAAYYGIGYEEVSDRAVTEPAPVKRGGHWVKA